MSSYVGYGLKAAKTPLGKKVIETVTKFFKSGSQKDKGKAIKSVKPGTQLTKKRRSQDDFTNFRSKLHTSAGFDEATKNKLKMKHPLYKSNKKTSDIFTPKEPKLAKGGRVEYKKGTGLMKKKSNVEKIKEAFAPRVSKNKKASKFGMLSVKAGIDKNPNPTQADRIAGAKMKSKKRFV